MKNILVHMCCAPCSIYPVEKLIELGFNVFGLFYNPNIQPAPEWEKRRDGVKEFENIFEIPVEYAPFEEQIDWLEDMEGLERCGFWHNQKS